MYWLYLIKGANPKEVLALEEGTINFNRIMISEFNVDFNKLTGAGAAGGLGASSQFFFKAKMVSGAQMILNIIKIEEILPQVQLVVTGEGKIDKQTQQGKVVKWVAEECNKAHVPVIALCGLVEIDLSVQKEMGLKYVSSILRKDQDIKTSLIDGYSNLVFASYNAISLLSGS